MEAKGQRPNWKILIQHPQRTQIPQVKTIHWRVFIPCRSTTREGTTTAEGGFVKILVESFPGTNRLMLAPSWL